VTCVRNARQLGENLKFEKAFWRQPTLSRDSRAARSQTRDTRPRDRAWINFPSASVRRRHQRGAWTRSDAWGFVRDGSNGSHVGANHSRAQGYGVGV